MNILFLSHYFPPEVNAPASRTFEHCREWARQGHKVTVITCFPNHPAGKIYDGYRHRLFQRERVEGIEVIRLWTLLAANEGFAMRIANYLSFMMMAILFCFRAPRADVVISTSPQFFCGLAGLMVSLLKRARWVLEIRDLWPESIVAVGAMKKGILIRFLYWLERFCYRSCDCIVTVTESFKTYMVGLGIDPEKIHVVTNGVRLDVYASDQNPDSDERMTAFRNQYNLHNRFVASYVGTHGMAHHLQTLIEAADLTRNDKQIVYLLVGDGAERNNLLQLRDKRGLQDQVIMVNQLPKSMMPVVWGVSDVSIVHLKKSPTFESVIPSKIFESLAMRKPVIHGVPGESAAIINRSGGGITFEPENAAELARVLTELAGDSERCAQMGEQGRHFVAEYYSRAALAEKILCIFEALLGEDKLARATGR